MERKVEYALPLIALLAPDEDLAVVAGRGQDVAVFRVGPGDAPDCSFVAVEPGFSMVMVFEGGRSAYPLRVSVRRCDSPSTSKIFTVLSEEQAASRRP